MAGGADAVGGIMQGVAAMTDGATNAVSTGVGQQAEPNIMVKNARDDFGDYIGALRRIVAEIKEKQDKADGYLHWLQTTDDVWQGGNATTQGWRAKGKRTGKYGGVWRDLRVYKDVAKANRYWDYIEPGGGLDKDLKKMRRTRSVVGWNTANTGNIAHYRVNARRVWMDLIGYDAFRDVLAANGVVVPWTSAEVLLPDALHLMWSNDTDAREDTVRGVAPADARNRVLNTVINLAAMGLLPREYRPPTWLYGLTPDERRQVPIGPTIAAVVKLADEGAGTASGTSAPGAVAGLPARRGAYGAAAAGSDLAATGSLADRIRALLLSGTGAVEQAEQAAATNPTVPPPPPTAEAWRSALSKALGRIKAKQKADPERYGQGTGKGRGVAVATFWQRARKPLLIGAGVVVGVAGAALGVRAARRQ